MGAGFINVLAGAGSMLTLPVLIFLGLDPITANGTNRIVILFENLTAARTLYHHNLVDLKKWGIHLITVMLKLCSVIKSMAQLSLV